MASGLNGVKGMPEGRNGCFESWGSEPAIVEMGVWMERGSSRLEKNDEEALF